MAALATHACTRRAHTHMPWSHTRHRRCSEVSRQPSAIRDLAIVVAHDLELQRLLDGIQANRPAIIQDIKLFDVYTGKGIGSGKKSLAFRIVMQDTQRTLQDAEVDAAVQQLVEYLQQAFAVQLRA